MIPKIGLCLRCDKAGGILNDTVLHRFSCFCSTPVFPAKGFTMTLGALGAVANGVQVNQVLADGPVLTDRVLPLRTHAHSSLISDKTTRDLKFVMAILELAIYTCLALGAHIGSPMMMMPWVIMKVFLMAVSVLFTSWNLVLQKPMTLSTIGLVGFLIEIHNFLTVLCLLDDINGH